MIIKNIQPRKVTPNITWKNTPNGGKKPQKNFFYFNKWGYNN